MPKKSTKRSATSAPKKASSRQSARSTVSVQKHAVEKSDKQSSPKALRVRKSYLLLGLIIIVFAAFLYFFRGFFVAAVVNGQPRPRLAVVRETEKQSGKQALNTLVRNTLIEQEAKKQNVSVSDDEINSEMKKVENTLSKQGQKLDQVLALQGMTREDLRKLIRLDKLVGKMVGKDVKVSDKDVADYIDKNKDTLPKDQSEDQIKNTVKERLRQQQLNSKVQSWLANLQSKAKILYFVQY